MIRVREVIVVEGKYDRQRVLSAVDALVVETGGFRLFHDADKKQMLRTLAQQRGLIILTDSDGAGLVIRNHISSFVPPDKLKQAYVPPLPGKEARKRQPSREGLLGVEGMDASVVVGALRRAGATVEEDGNGLSAGEPLTKRDLYDLGLSGRPDSAVRRRALAARLGLPSYLSAARLAEVVGVLMTRAQLEALLKE